MPANTERLGFPYSTHGFAEHVDIYNTGHNITPIVVVDGVRIPECFRIEIERHADWDEISTDALRMVPRSSHMDLRLHLRVSNITYHQEDPPPESEPIGMPHVEVAYDRLRADFEAAMQGHDIYTDAVREALTESMVELEDVEDEEDYPEDAYYDEEGEVMAAAGIVIIRDEDIGYISCNKNDHLHLVFCQTCRHTWVDSEDECECTCLEPKDEKWIVRCLPPLI